MSSSPAFPPWLATKPAEKPANGRVHILPDDDEPPADSTKPTVTPFVAGDAKGDLIHSKGENTMPRGQYPRKKKAVSGDAPGEAVPPPAVKARRSRRAPKPDTNTPRFGVFDDGSVHVNTANCRGALTAGEAADLLAFIGKLRGGKDAKR